MVARALAIVLVLGLVFVIPGCNGTTGKDQTDAGGQSAPNLRSFWTDDCDVTVTPGAPINGVGQFIAAYDHPLVAAGRRKVVVDFDGWIYQSSTRSPMLVVIDTDERRGSNPAHPVEMRFQSGDAYRLELERDRSVLLARLYKNHTLKWTDVIPEQTSYNRSTSYPPLVRVVPVNNTVAQLHVTYDNIKTIFKLRIVRP